MVIYPPPPIKMGKPARGVPVQDMCLIVTVRPHRQTLSGRQES
jgi:hypothetical protein